MISNINYLLFSRLHGRHPPRGQAPPPPPRPERHPVGPGHHGQEPQAQLPVQQPLRERHLPKPVRVRRPVDGIRVLVSLQLIGFQRYNRSKNCYSFGNVRKSIVCQFSS